MSIACDSHRPLERDFPVLARLEADLKDGVEHEVGDEGVILENAHGYDLKFSHEKLKMTTKLWQFFATFESFKHSVVSPGVKGTLKIEISIIFQETQVFPHSLASFFAGLNLTHCLQLILREQ